MLGLRTSRGFSLVEVLVGVAIGLIATVVIFQVFAVSERQKRTTTGAADAQSNGAIALHMIGRDVRMAGWGAESSTFAACDTVFSYYDDGVNPPVSPNPNLTNLVASVVVTDGASGGPDTLGIQYYANPSDPAAFNYKPAMTSLSDSMPQPSSELKVASVYGCGVGDLALVQQAGNCTLMQITQVQGGSLHLQHNPGGTPSYNPPANCYNAGNPCDDWVAYTEGAKLQCMPQSSSSLFWRTYRINLASRELELVETNTAAALSVAPHVVDMQVQYGIANAGSQQVSSWVSATGAWVAPLSAANARRIKAIRVALVVRSEQYEKPDVSSGTCSATTATMAANWSTWATFVPANYSSDWQCYRYKVFESVIPLRNIIWANL